MYPPPPPPPPCILPAGEHDWLLLNWVGAERVAVRQDPPPPPPLPPHLYLLTAPVCGMSLTANIYLVMKEWKAFILIRKPTRSDLEASSQNVCHSLHRSLCIAPLNSGGTPQAAERPLPKEAADLLSAGAESSPVKVEDCGEGLWRQVADLDVTGGDTECPGEWEFTTSPRTGCTKPDAAALLLLPPHPTPWSTVECAGGLLEDRRVPPMDLGGLTLLQRTQKSIVLLWLMVSLSLTIPRYRTLGIISTPRLQVPI